MYNAQSRDGSHRSPVQDGMPAPLDRKSLELPSGLRNYHQTPPSSGLSSFEPSAAASHSSTLDVDETEDSGAFVIALDAPSAPRPEGNPSQIYIGRENNHLLWRNST